MDGTRSAHSLSSSSPCSLAVRRAHIFPVPTNIARTFQKPFTSDNERSRSTPPPSTATRPLRPENTKPDSTDLPGPIGPDRSPGRGRSAQAVARAQTYRDSASPISSMARRSTFNTKKTKNVARTARVVPPHAPSCRETRVPQTSCGRGHGSSHRPYRRATPARPTPDVTGVGHPQHDPNRRRHSFSFCACFMTPGAPLTYQGALRRRRAHASGDARTAAGSD